MHQTRRWPLVAGVLVAFGVSMVGGIVVGGEVGQFAALGLAVAPLMVLVGLLQLGDSRLVRALSWTQFWLIIVVLAALMVAIVQAALPVVVGIVVVGIVLAATGAWYAVGRALGAHVEPGSRAHAQGTLGLILGSALAFTPLIVLGGQAPLAMLMAGLEGELLAGGARGQLLQQVYTLIWGGLFVVWACGWPARSTLRDAARRLGLGPLHRSNIVELALVTIATVFIGTWCEMLSAALLDWLGWPRTDAELFSRLLPAARLPLGVVVLAVSAGVSEELLVRGLLQPRFGWFLANFAFVAAHAFQYGLDGLLVVFVIGSVHAWVRWRWNTTAAIVVHTGYDLILLGYALMVS